MGRGRSGRLSSRLPPVALLAVAFAAGASLPLSGALSFLALLLTAFALLPIGAFRRPSARVRVTVGLVAAVLGGLATASSAERARSRDCRLHLRTGTALELTGTVAEAVRWGRARVRVDAGLPAGCGGVVSVRLPGEAPGLSPGDALRATGRWGSSGDRDRDPTWAGQLEAEAVVPVARSGSVDPLRWRITLRARLDDLFPERAGLVAALVLARKDGLDREVRDAFTRSGTAHLLAISGFHVGVVAGLVLALLRFAGASRRRAGVLGAVVVWGYVLFIGAPDAAVRAALILTLMAAGRTVGRPVAPLGGLATAFLLLLAVDPHALLRPGFQLSFAGAAGLALAAGPLERRLRRLLDGSGATFLRPLAGPVAAGVAATLATLPVVAWHFDRVSLVGIPATLVGTPLVAAAIPGIFGSLALLPVAPPLAAFLAGGVELILGALETVMTVAGGLPFAVVDVGRPLVVAGLTGAAATAALTAGAVRLGWGVRLAVTAAGAAAVMLAWPLARAAGSSGSLEIAVLDVGQGDAIAIRSPRDRWIVVDAGPGERGVTDPGRTRLVRELRALGVRRVEALVLTHPDLDHIGGAPAVMAALPVAAVIDPGRPRGTRPFRDALEAARLEPARWIRGRRGAVLDFDGVEIELLHPVEALEAPDPNDHSVVLLLRFGLFSALLTGDAPASVEDPLGGEVGKVDVLKVGHHGSRTSSSGAFLAAVRPELALVSVGRRNRYGHPDPGVLGRLERHADSILRTDRHGSIRVVARRTGEWEAVVSRRPH